MRVKNTLLWLGFVCSLTSFAQEQPPENESYWNKDSGNNVEGIGLLEKEVLGPVEGESDAFWIDLKITGKSVQQTRKTDVVLVLDYSGSMNTSPVSRIENLRLAVRGFTTKLLTGSNKQNEAIRIAAIRFSTDATVISPFTYDSIDINKSQVFLNTASGYTNIQDALMGARDLLKDSPASNKVIILLSDGEPNYSFKGTAAELISEGEIIAYDGYSSPHIFKLTAFDYGDVKHGDHVDYKVDNFPEWIKDYDIPTISEALLFKDINAGQQIFSVGIQLNKSSAKYVLKNVASGEVNYYPVEQAQDIPVVLQKMAKRISNSIINGTVTDPMGAYVTMTPFINNGGTNNVTYLLEKSSEDIPTPQVDWDDQLNTFKITGISLGEDESIKLRYKVVLNKSKEGFVNKNWYETNGITTLTEGGKSYNFPIPQVNGYSEVSLPITKVWQGKTGESVNLNITSVSSPYALDENVILTENENWTTSLRVRQYGDKTTTHPITYKLVETPVPGYLSVVTPKEIKTDDAAAVSKGFTVTNIETTNVEGRKIWRVEDQSKIPASVQIKLLRNDVALEDSTKTVSVENDWKYSWVNLPKYSEDGKTTYTYTVDEQEIPGFQKVIDGDDIINIETATIAGTKIWRAPQGTDLPPSINVHLQTNVITSLSTVNNNSITVTAENGWKYKWENQPLFESNGNPIEYYVEENDQPGYVVTYPKGTYDIVNTIEGKVGIYIEKVWNVPLSVKIPESIKIDVLQNGTPVDQLILSEQVVNVLSGLKSGGFNLWYAYEEYSQYREDGLTEYTYTVREVSIPGYVQTITGGQGDDGNYSFTITNTLNPSTPVNYLKVTLPPVDIKCITTNPAPGDYFVKEGECFTFNFVIEECCENPKSFKPIVTANGVPVVPDATGTYSICDIRQAVTIGIKNDAGTGTSDPVATDKLNDGSSRIWTEAGQLNIYAEGKATFTVYSLTGQLVKQGRVNGGETVRYVLKPGIYLTKLSDGTQAKVIIE